MSTDGWFFRPFKTLAASWALSDTKTLLLRTCVSYLTRRLLRRSHCPENNEIRAMVQKAGIQILNRKKILWTFKKNKRPFRET
jgi:hypothetical protein